LIFFFQSTAVDDLPQTVTGREIVDIGIQDFAAFAVTGLPLHYLQLRKLIHTARDIIACDVRVRADEDTLPL
jgi:hypothetical protein